MRVNLLSAPFNCVAAPTQFPLHVAMSNSRPAPRSTSVLMRLCLACQVKKRPSYVILFQAQLLPAKLTKHQLWLSSLLTALCYRKVQGCSSGLRAGFHDVVVPTSFAERSHNEWVVATLRIH
jgi:hypothetical protein